LAIEQFAAEHFLRQFRDPRLHAVHAGLHEKGTTIERGKDTVAGLERRGGTAVVCGCFV
jgi:hypothetical protein